MPDFKTNAVDSFVYKKNGRANGECKIYLRKDGGVNSSGYDEPYYRNYFRIDGAAYGITKHNTSDGPKYRDNGPRICYVEKSGLKNYFDNVSCKMTDDQIYEIKEFLFSLGTIEYFTSNYVFDSQNRSYIGSVDDFLTRLRVLCISRQTIVNFEKDNEGDIKISLEPGQIL